jgi:hypothetical protein
MPRRPATPKQTGTTPDLATSSVAPSDAAARQPVTGIVGDASAAATRSGDDTRKRGWFWHWNHVITQYAPLLGLKGVGLLNSYTVWTDRREESPHRGYAFPSQQSEADFYGEDRAELITINKILVTLDLIEIRKEMVYRTDERGRRWKVPHNFYRVKDQGEGMNLTTRQVMCVVELADRDRAVYRYLRKLFSPKFSPIDPDNVWHQILEEVRPTDAWQRLAAKTERDESRASARSRAGHAARRSTETTDGFPAPTGDDNPTPKTTVADSTTDSRRVTNDSLGGDEETSVASTNTGLGTTVASSNRASGRKRRSSVAPSNTDGPTSVAPSNRTYHQDQTTTTRGSKPFENPMTTAIVEPVAEAPAASNATVPATPFEVAPDAARDEAIAFRHFEEANDRPATAAERRILRNLAETFAAAAGESGETGWRWIAEATDEAVSSGSRYVAPKRIREILVRWQAEGRGEYVGGERRRAASTQGVPEPLTRRRGRDRAPAVERAGPPPAFTIEECGLSSRQVWNMAITQLRASPEFGALGAEAWLRDTHLLDRTDEGGYVIGVGNALALRRLDGRYRETIARVLAAITGHAAPVTIADYRTWSAEATG